MAYQVTWGGGEAWTVQVSRTVACSQTAWERSGIQNQGPRPEHSSLSSLASRTFSSACRRAGVHDSDSQGLAFPTPLLPPFPTTPRLWSQTHVCRSPLYQQLRGNVAQRTGQGFETSWPGVTAKLCHLLGV